jgi:hypothetical protein
MLVMNSPIVEQTRIDDSGKRMVVFETDEELDDYSRKLLGVDKETYKLLLAEAEAELLAESGL